MARGYINIAIVKYWGKKKFAPYLIPYQGSISLRSNKLFTKTHISFSNEDKFYLNGILQDEKETKKIFDFVNKLVPNRKKICIHSKNYVPTAAGLASSSSAYCALTKSLNKFFNLNLNTKQMAKISTIGSGSSSRSFYHISAFDKNGNIYPLKTNLNLSMLAIIVNKNKKEISSREAMEKASKTKFFKKWVKKANLDFENMKIALKENDFKKIGTIMEENTLLMHETTKHCNPSFSFLSNKTFEVIEIIKNVRKDGLNIYYTMDAGENVKILYLKEDEEKILNILKKYFKGNILLC